MTNLEKWQNGLIELEDYFNYVSLPALIRLDECSLITDCPKFVKTHLEISKANIGKRTYIPYVLRLKKLREILNQTK